MSDTAYREQGPFLLLAGPGTGKTYQLALRMKYLVMELGVPPEQVTMLTFTGAAAREMRERISNPDDNNLYIAPEYQPKSICTMHSRGYSIVNTKAATLGLSAPSVLSRSDVPLLLGDAAQLVGQPRNEGESVEACRRIGRCEPASTPKCRTCSKYREIARACNAIDYDEQILLACELLESDAELLAECRAGCTHLLVDEYQDINAAQFRLIQLLSAESLEGLFAVGDDDQSIYSWRGGSPEFVRGFLEDFGPDSRAGSLRCSRRCHRSILEGATALVKQHDPERTDKGDMRYLTEDGPPIRVHNVPSDIREAEIALAIIQEALPAKDVLVLVPTRAHAGPLLEKLRQARIRCEAPRLAPGDGLPQLATLASWLGNREDNVALRQCVQAMLDGGALGVPGERARKPEKMAEREQALRDIANLWQVVLDEKVSLWESMEAGAESSKVIADAYAQLQELRDHDAKDVPGFLGLSVQLMRPWASTDRFMAETADWIGLATEDARPSDGSVRVMTLQGAKGLQADVVCVLGLEEGTVPKKDASPGQLAEQARLLFVSMTRAKEELHLFHARKRSGGVSFQSPYASGGKKLLEGSSFLDHLPEEHCKRCYHRSKTQRKRRGQ